MKFTNDEKLIARSLCKSKDTLDLLHKLFLSDIDTEVKNRDMIEIDDAEYGRLMKVHRLVEAHIRKQLNELKLAGVDNSTAKSPIAPR